MAVFLNLILKKHFFQIVFIDTVSLVFCDALVREGLMLFLLFHLMLRLRLMFL